LLSAKVLLEFFIGLTASDHHVHTVLGAAMSSEETRRFCIKFNPTSETSLLLELAKRGTITSDQCRTVFWAELSGATEAELERLPGVLKVIEYTQPLWSDVLGK
jgi:hypothetical protein